MGEFATAVQIYLRDSLANAYPSITWDTEYMIGETPVDIGGRGSSRLLLVELEWRRADPADNAAKLFRHLETGEMGVGNIDLFHVFTDYYTLSRGDISSKRKNAEFVGRMAADAFDQLSYHPITFGLEPPKRGMEWPKAWKQVANDVAASITEEIDSGY